MPHKNSRNQKHAGLAWVGMTKVLRSCITATFVVFFFFLWPNVCVIRLQGVDWIAGSSQLQADECNPIGKRFPDKSFLCGNIFSPLDQNTANNQLLIYFRFFLNPKGKAILSTKSYPPWNPLDALHFCSALHSPSFWPPAERSLTEPRTAPIISLHLWLSGGSRPSRAAVRIHWR